MSTTAASPVERLRAALEKVRPSGDGFTARCPAHDDDHPSLSFSEGEDGRALVNCHAGCSTEDVVRALGLEMDDLFNSENGGPSKRRGWTASDYAAYVGVAEGWLRSEFGVRTEREPGKAPTVAIPYRDAGGGTVRTRHRTRESFWWARDGNGVTLYGLHRLADADPSRAVLLVEGESDVHALAFHDVLAVGVPGASSWRSSWARHLDGRDVFVWMEPDQGGGRLVADVADDLSEAHVIEAPDDAADPAELHEVAGEGFRERLSALTREATPILRISANVGVRRKNGGEPASAQGSSNSANIANVDWGSPIPLGPEEPEPYPVDRLPHWLGAHVVSVAASTQTPTDLPLLVGLSALSVAAANKARVVIRPGHTEPAHLWTATVLPPGSRKSPVFHEMTAPIREYETELVERTAPERQRARDERDVVERALKDAKKSAARTAGDDGYGEARQRVNEIREKLDGLDVPPKPRLLADDVTSERLVQLMADNAGRVGVLAPEADLFRTMEGRYSGTTSIGPYKRAWTGDEPIRDDRMGREGSHVRRPALTFGLTLQPSVLETLERKESFRGEGLLARFVWGVPEHGIGHRLTGSEVPTLNGDAARRYAGNLRQLLEAEPRAVEDGEYVPHELHLSDGARDVLFGFEDEVENLLAPGGRLEHVRDWGAKLCGHVTRIAALLHLASQVGSGSDLWSADVFREAMEAAVEIGRAAVPHALQVFDALEADPEVRLARYLLKRVQELDPSGEDEQLTKRDLFEAVKGKVGLGTVEELDDVLRTLEGHNLVRVVDRSTGGPGRPPSPWIVPNPKAEPSRAHAPPRATTTDIRTIRKTPPQEEGAPLSANTANVDDTDDDPEVLL